jgi:hypothetical protein
MTGSSSSSRRFRVAVRRVFALAAIGMAVAPGSAAAQVGEPLQLLPQTTPGYETPPPATPDPGTGTGEPTAPQGFEIAPLDAIGTDYAGTLEPDAGGLGLDMWHGTDRIKVERLLPALKPTTSPILAELTRRLLLSNAAAPAGRGSGKNLMPLRAGLLADMGLVEDAVALLRLLPVDQRDGDSARQLAELSWRAGDPDGACAVVQESLPRLPVDSFWQEAAIFCQLRAGQTDQAMLGLDLLREEGETDEIFFTLASAVAGETKVDIPPLPVVTPLYLAMARAAGMPVPKIAVHEPPPLMLALIAESPEGDLESRLTMAETTAAAGVLSSKHLAALYTAEPEDPGTLDTALDLPDIGTTPSTRAILYQAAVRAALPEQRASFIQKALDADVSDPNYWARLQLYLPLLADIPATPDLAWFAEDAARHLFAGGKLIEAQAWVAVLEQGPQTDPDVTRAMPRLHALDYLAEGTVEQAGAVATVLDDLPPADSRAERLRALFAPFDEPAVPAIDDPQVFAATAPAPAMPQQNVNLWLDLGDAAAKQRVGETVLLTLAGLNATGLANAEPEWLSRSITSLRDVGLAQESRRLAIEAAILNGL